MYRSCYYSKLKNFIRSTGIFRKFSVIAAVLEKPNVGLGEEFAKTEGPYIRRRERWILRTKATDSYTEKPYNRLIIVRLEAELAFCETLDQLQGAIGDLLKYVFIETRNTNEADIFLIDRGNKAPSWVTKEFVTLTYDEARQILLKKGSTLTDEGINKEQELTLVEHCNGVPVFVVKWPKDMKSFYMKECCEDSTKVNDSISIC